MVVPTPVGTDAPPATPDRRRWRPAAPRARVGPIDVSVCIANWNCRDMLRACLVSLLDQPQGVALEVVVTDNASADGAADMVADEFPDVTLVRNTANLGFSRANNQAAELAQGRYVFFLNNDTVVPAGTLGRLVAFADAHPEAGLIGPRLRDGHGRWQISYRQQPTVAALLHRTALLRWTGLFRRSYLRYRRDSFQPGERRRVEILMGAAMLMPRRLFEECGRWDEDFTFGGEDIELSTRVGRTHQLVYLPDAEILHYGRVSTRQNVAFTTPNVAVGHIQYLRKAGVGPLTLAAYKATLTLDAPLQIAGKLAQAAWRVVRGKRVKARRSWLAVRGLWSLFGPGLWKFWRA